jgi:phosphatidylethanolamine/phosphatidyl-N-methylethanolamine N-methyltransferase
MADASHGSGLREHVLIFTRFLKNPRTVGAVSPSSRTLARSMMKLLPADIPIRLVELGPGTGALTGALADHLAPESRFLAIELEPAFVRKIRQRWPGVEVVCASAERLEELVKDRGLHPVDHIVSGLPFASLPADMTRQILDGIERTLRPGGTFTTFQYVYAYAWARPAADFRAEMTRRMGGPPEKRLVSKNIPPAFILTWTRK